MSEKDLQKEILDLKAQLKKFQKNNLGLVFEEKPEDVVTQCQENIPILKEVLSRRIATKNNLNNLLIEGDNYHALSVLNYTHKKTIDLIYIDPPYNTGASDWKYNNDYVDKEDTYRHSKWLSLMRHRLNLARDLLKDEGFLICAIDHNELFTVGVLLDKILGEENRIGIITVVHKPEGRNQEKFFGTSNEFMLVYAKNIRSAKFNKVVLDSELQDRFDEEDENGKYRLKNFIRLTDGKYSLRESKPHFFYPVYVSKDLNNFSITKKTNYEKVFPITEKGVERTWKTTKNTLEKLAKNGDIVAKRETNGIVLYEKLREDQVIKTHWMKKEYHAYHFGTKILESILGTKKFDFPKSLHLIFDILKLTTKKDAVILDFFAGSGTTGHAVLALNNEDNGARKFILCTNNENNIAEDVTYERVKRVINGYKDLTTGVKIAGLGGNLTYYKTDLVNIGRLHKVPDEAKIRVTYQVGEMIAVREDTLSEVEKNDWWQIFEGDGRATAVYFKEDKTKLGELIVKLEKKNIPVALYIFSWGKNEYKGEYSSEKIRVEDIPEPILEVYKEINRP